MIQFEQVDHVSLTVRDLEASKVWYEHVLGLVTLRQVQRDDFTRAILHYPGQRPVLGLTEHHSADKEASSEARAGLDHVAFGVASLSLLDSFCRRFVEERVSYSGILEDAGGFHVVLRDPDNIQLELISPPKLPRPFP
jgi:catechol 2,3-dioxygenase-like lactoylglutathione lyase family enzyme